MALAISGAALQLDGNQADRFTLNGELYKATKRDNLQQGRCEMLGVIQLRVHFSSSRPQQLPVWLGIVL